VSRAKPKMKPIVSKRKSSRRGIEGRVADAAVGPEERFRIDARGGKGKKKNTGAVGKIKGIKDTQ